MATHSRHALGACARTSVRWVKILFGWTGLAQRHDSAVAHKTPLVGKPWHLECAYGNLGLLVATK